MHAHTTSSASHTIPSRRENAPVSGRRDRDQPHWGLFFWRGNPRHRRLPDHPVAWLSAPREVRYGCCESIDGASQWMWDRLSVEKIALTSDDQGADPERIGQDIAQALHQGRDILIKRILERDEAWALAVVASPLCLSPTSCRTGTFWR